MVISEKIEKLHELINTSMSVGKKQYAVKLLNSIIDKLNYDEAVINSRRSKRLNIEFEKFDDFFEKCVFCLQAIGFDKTELVTYNDEALIFINTHKHKLKKPLTVEYLNTLHMLYNYYEWMNDKAPTNLTDLKHAYTEIESNR